jgi:hypothetical protein
MQMFIWHLNCEYYKTGLGGMVQSWVPFTSAATLPKPGSGCFCLYFEKTVIVTVICFLLVNFPASEFYMPTFQNTLFHLHRPIHLWRWNRESVTKYQHIKFRYWGISQKKAYNIQNTVKVWNQELLWLLHNLKVWTFILVPTQNSFCSQAYLLQSTIALSKCWS